MYLHNFKYSNLLLVYLFHVKDVHIITCIGDNIYTLNNMHTYTSIQQIGTNITLVY